MANSIGSLYIDITARTADLEKDMEKVKKQMAGVGVVTKQAGAEAASAFKSFNLFNSFQGRGMTGITLDMMAFSMALRAVQNEILYVYENIDRIHGIRPEAIQNVNEFKVNLHEARNEIDKIIASGMSGFLQFGKMIGTSLGELFYGDQGPLDTKLDTLDKIRHASDPAYYEKVREAQFKLSEMEKQRSAGLLTQAARVELLNKQAADYLIQSKSASIDSLTQEKRKIEAFQLQAEAARITSDMMRRLRSYRRQEVVEDEKSNMNELSQLGRILELKRLVAHFESEVNTRVGTATAGQAGILGPRTAAENEKLLQDYPQLLAYTTMLRLELNSLKSPTQELVAVFSQGMGSMSTALRQLVTGAQNDFQQLLKTVADKIIETFISLAIINPMINGLFGGVKGFSLLPAFFGAGAVTPGKADGGPARGLTLVGERGPELLNLGSGSTIIPNYAMRGGGGSGGPTIYVDARGADQARIEQLERNLMSINATFERRAFSALANFNKRRGSMAAAMN